MTPEASGPGLPEAVQQALSDVREHLRLDLHAWMCVPGSEPSHVFPDGCEVAPDPSAPGLRVPSWDGAEIAVELRSPPSDQALAQLKVLSGELERALEYDQEVRFFTYELSERYEEINLLYSISETLGSVLELADAARAILEEVCDVMAAHRGSLWVYRPESGLLELVASVGSEGRVDPIAIDHPTAITARVFREGRAVIFGPDEDRRRAPASRPFVPERRAETDEDSGVLSVPIRYTPPSGVPRTVGVVNLMGRTHGERFSTSDQKLLSAIASQVGAALENNRLIRESLAQERVSKEMELAHDLQMKLMPAVRRVEGAQVGARVRPAESVGGDFFQVLGLPDDRVGVMIGDVSSHGFPAALIMALSMSAASIYASSGAGPAEVLRQLDDALRPELESTEMYLNLFYGVLDREGGSILYANAGHPHAFVVHADGSNERLFATDPPVGIAGPDAYDQVELPWAVGEDLLFLFTDGMSDVLAAAGRGDGEQLVLAEVARLRDRRPDLIVDHLFEMVDRATPAIPADDRTAVVVRV